MKPRHIQDVLFSLLILGILFFLNVPYLSIVLCAGLILAYGVIKGGVGKELGFIQPAHLFQSIGIAIMMAVVLVLISFFLLLPSLELITGKAINMGPFAQLQGNTSLLFTTIAIGWVVGGFMEEIIFRGFLLSRIMVIIPGRAGPVIGVILTASIFGYLHDYQGITGQLLTGVLGAILGGIYVMNEGRIWLNILIHGFVNTISMVWLFAGMA